MKCTRLRSAWVLGTLAIASLAFANDRRIHEKVIDTDASRTLSNREFQTNMDLLNVRAGGGIEGLGLALDQKLTAGPMWSVAGAIQPLSFLGGEIGYAGSTHEVDSNFIPVGADGATSGADFVRNGMTIAATLNAPTRVIQPYGLVGVGFDAYNWRGPASAVFDDDMAGRVPWGVGLKAEAGPVVADLRFNYNTLFSQNFARAGVGDGIGSSWDLGLQAGGQF